jgi:hypothetical protein
MLVYNRLKIWVPVVFYVLTLLLTAPYLIPLERFVAPYLGTTLGQVGNLLGWMGSSVLFTLLLYIIIARKSYREKSAYIATFFLLIFAGAGYRFFFHLHFAIEITHLGKYAILAVIFFYAFKREMETTETTTFFYFLFTLLVFLTGCLDWIVLDKNLSEQIRLRLISPGDRISIYTYTFFTLLGFCLYLLQRKKKHQKRDVYILSCLYCLLVGVIDELFQGWLPSRVYDLNDIVTCFRGDIMGLIFLWGFLKPEWKKRDLTIF